MNVRRATVEDAAAIAAIHVRSWQEGYRGIVPDEFLRSLSVERREAAWRETLQKGTSNAWVAADAGRVVGWVSAGASRDEDADSTTGEVWAIYVDPTAWRRGAGRALWQAAESHLRAAGFESVTLWVLADNERARCFYESIGFSLDPGHDKTLERGGAILREIRLRRGL